MLLVTRVKIDNVTTLYDCKFHFVKDLMQANFMKNLYPYSFYQLCILGVLYGVTTLLMGLFLNFEISSGMK